MSSPGPDPVRLARLHQLRSDFHDLAKTSPSACAVVCYRPPVSADSPALSQDPASPFIRGFVDDGGRLSANVRSLFVTLPPYHPRTSRPSSDRIDIEGIVRAAWASDSRAERAFWYATLWATQQESQQMKLPAGDATTLLRLRENQAETPTYNWLLHLANSPQSADHVSERVVFASEPHRTAGVGLTHARHPLTWTDEDWRRAALFPSLHRVFVTGPSVLDTRRLSELGEGPTWWLVTLTEVFRLSRDVVDAAIQTPLAPDLPEWSRTERQLCFRGVVLRDFSTKQAKNQEAILDQFQEKGWPPAVQTSLSGDARKQAIKELNEKMVPSAITFHRDGTEKGVGWEVTDNPG
jgi:hypothetical protein